MVHGDAFLQYDHQGGPRGDDQLGSINWGMLMAMRRSAGGTLHLHGMASAEPLHHRRPRLSPPAAER